jgi:cullin-associated NEDD8-dissociated protein 1
MIGLFIQIQTVLLQQLCSDRLALRKRAISALGYLVSVCSNVLFAKTLDFLIDELRRNESLSTTRTYVAAVGAVCRAAGQRFAEYLPKVLMINGAQ